MVDSARWRKRINNGIRLLRSRIQRGGLILFYHRVTDRDIDPFEQCLAPEYFAAHMKWLSQWANVISLAEMVSGAKRGQLPARSITITFDDGYADNLYQALPILEQAQLPATLFVATGNHNQPFWWDILATTILRPSELPAELPDAIKQLLGVEKHMARDELLFKLHSYLQPLKPEKQQNTLELIARWSGTALGEKEDRAMTIDELRQIANSPLIDIGAHTRGHLNLAAHTPQFQQEMIAANLADLQQIFKQSINHFSYPYGLAGQHFTPISEQIVAKLGFEVACSTDVDVVTGRSNTYALPRLWVQKWPLERFQREIKLWLGG